MKSCIQAFHLYKCCELPSAVWQLYQLHPSVRNMGDSAPISTITVAGGPLGKLSLDIQVEQLKPYLHTERASDRV